MFYVATAILTDQLRPLEHGNGGSDTHDRCNVVGASRGCSTVTWARSDLSSLKQSRRHVAAGDDG